MGIDQEAAMKAIKRMYNTLENYRRILDILRRLLMQSDPDEEDEELFSDAQRVVNELHEIVGRAEYYTMHPEELTEPIKMNILNELRLKNTELYMIITTLTIKKNLGSGLANLFRSLMG